MIAWVIYTLLLSHQDCSSTVFGMLGDKHGGRSATVYHKRPVDPKKDIGIAHRDLPMGMMVRVQNLRTGRSSWARVIDRGPYGMRDHEGWFNSRLPENRERAKRALKLRGQRAYCGCADLTPRLGRIIGHNFGRDRVRISW